MNKKGFMLFETLVASTFILGTLIFLYIQFSSIERSYDTSFRYNTITGLYNAKTLSNYLETDGYALYDYELSKDSSIGYLQINNCQKSRGLLCKKIINNINAKNVLFVGNNISILQSNLSTSNYDKTLFNEEFKKFILTQETVEKEGRSRLIIEYNDNTFACIAIGISKAGEDKVDFQVNHYQMNKDGITYTLVEEDTRNYTWFNGYEYETQANSYSGFKKPADQTIVASDGLIIKYYYERNQYNVSVEKGTNVESVTGSGVYYHGETVTLSATSSVGYNISSWSGDYNTNIFKMPIQNVSVKANASPNTNTKYIVRHYQMNVTGSGYTLKETQSLTGTTDTLISPSVKNYIGFTSPSKKSAIINGDGSTVIDYYYTRNKYSVTVATGTGISSVSGSGTYYYGASVTIGYTLQTGYHFSGWTGSYTSSTFTMPASNVAIQANGAINTYTIVYNGNGNTSGNTAASSHTYGVAKVLTANGFTKTGYTFAGWSTSANGAVVYSNKQSVSNLTVANNTTVTLYAKWTANTYTIKYVANGGSGTMADTICTYDKACILRSNLFTKSGYNFNGWSGSNGVGYLNGASVTNLTSANGGIITMTANWKVSTVVLNGLTGGRYDETGLCSYISSYGISNKSFSYNGYTNCKFTSYSCDMDCDDMGYNGWYGWGDFAWNDGGWWDVWAPAACSGNIICTN